MAQPTLGPRVLIVLNTATAWSHGVLRGFSGVARERGWTLLHCHPTADLRWLVQQWRPEVVVLQRSLHRDVAQALEGCAVIAVNEDGSADGVASVCLDEAGIAALAAAHLSGKGLRELTTFRFNDGAFA